MPGRWCGHDGTHLTLCCDRRIDFSLLPLPERDDGDAEPGCLGYEHFGLCSPALPLACGTPGLAGMSCPMTGSAIAPAELPMDS